MTVYYTDRAPAAGALLAVPVQRVRHFHTSQMCAPGQLDAGIHQQYAFTLDSDTPVICQHLKISDDHQSA